MGGLTWRGLDGSGIGSLPQVLCSTVSSLDSEAVVSSVSSVLVMEGRGFV